MSHDSLVTKPASGHWTDAYPELGRGPVSLEDCVSRGVLREGTRARLQEDLALRGTGRAGAEVRQLFHPRAEVPQHLDHHRAGQGRRDPRLPQHLPAPRQQDAVGGRPVPGGVQAARRCCTAASTAGVTSWTAHCTRPPARICCSTSTPTAAGCLRFNARCGKASSSSTSIRTTPSRCGRFLGELAHGIEGYPFEGPHQVYQFKVELQCNWKIFVDGFAESYHGPYLHASSFGSVTAEARDALDKPNPFTDALAYQLKGPHRMFSFSGEPSRKTPYSKPIECVMEASAAGPWTKRTDRGPMPPGLNPTRSEKYGFDSFQFFPNFVLIFGASGFSTSTRTGRPGRTRTSSKWRCSISPRPRTRSGWARN